VTDPIRPQPPIALFEGTSYQGIFGSLDDLLGYVEAIDVRNDEYRVYDARGQELVLTAESDAAAVRAATSPEDPDPDRLRAQLAEAVRYLGQGGSGLIDVDLDLPALLRAIWRFEHPKRPYPD
jgi:hypothetical protein